MLIRPSPALFKRSVWKGTFLSFLLLSFEAAHVVASLGTLNWMQSLSGSRAAKCFNLCEKGIRIYEGTNRKFERHALSGG
jgi:hypothetical protein